MWGKVADLGSHENPVGRATVDGWEQVSLLRAGRLGQGSIQSPNTLFPPQPSFPQAMRSTSRAQG